MIKQSKIQMAITCVTCHCFENVIPLWYFTFQDYFEQYNKGPIWTRVGPQTLDPKIQNTLTTFPFPKLESTMEVLGVAPFHFPTLVGTCSSHGQLGLSFGSFPLSCLDHHYKPKTRVVTLTWHTNNLEPWIIVYFKLFINLYII